MVALKSIMGRNLPIILSCNPFFIHQSFSKLFSRFVININIKAVIYITIFQIQINQQVLSASSM